MRGKAARADGTASPLSLDRRRDHPRAGRAERRVRDERAGDRLGAQGAAGGDGADRQARRARAAILLAADPGKFLSTVQIGITLIGIVAGAYSGASLGDADRARGSRRWGWRRRPRDRSASRS